ncbi:MAG: hypothetical protein U9N61_11720, partial [Euryarchaeota archaeon]|nr:hypothetical protein [Euryarchaeota archaeon]
MKMMNSGSINMLKRSEMFLFHRSVTDSTSEMKSSIASDTVLIMDMVGYSKSIKVCVTMYCNLVIALIKMLWLSGIKMPENQIIYD